MLLLESLYSKILLQKLTGVSWSSFVIWSRETKAESSQKKPSCWSSVPPSKMLLLWSMITTSSLEKMFWSNLFFSKPMFLSCCLKASSEQAVVALVVICHLFLKFKVSKILKLSSWRSMLLKLSFPSSAASLISLMRLVFSQFVLSWVAAGVWPLLLSTSWLWEAVLAEGFFLLLLLAPCLAKLLFLKMLCSYLVVA